MLKNKEQREKAKNRELGIEINNKEQRINEELKKRMKINTVIFDFDGTIADTNKIIIDSWQAVYRAYTGKEGDEDYILSTFGEPLYYSMEKAFPDHDVEETVAIYRGYQKDIYRKEIKLFPGMEELIRGLKEKNYKTGIVTSRLKQPTYEGLEVFGIEDQIDEIVTVEDTDKHKPDPEPARICLERLNSKPEESIMIGDSYFDMGCGKNAGMKTVMVGWSQAADSVLESVALKGVSPEERIAFTPDYIIKTSDQVWDIIAEINRE